MARIATGVLVAVAAMVNGAPTQAAQYTSERTACTEQTPPAERGPDVGYQRAVTHGQTLVWVPSGLSWQMKTTYGSMSRHFGATKNGMNFAPNKTTNPRDNDPKAAAHRVMA
jgi:hypothetical protein